MNPQNGGIFSMNSNGTVQPLTYPGTMQMNRDMTQMAYVQPQSMRQQQPYVMNVTAPNQMQNQQSKLMQTQQQMQVQGMPQPQQMQARMVAPATQFPAPADQHPLQKTHTHQPEMQPRPMEPEYAHPTQQPAHPATQQQKHPTQQIVTIPHSNQHPTQQLETHSPHMANREDVDVTKQRERPKNRRKPKYRDVSNPTSSANHAPQDSKKFSGKGRSELEEEEVQSLPPIPSKLVPHREEKQTRSGPPGFHQAKRSDPAPSSIQHEAPMNERHAEEDGPKSKQNQANAHAPVEKAKPTPVEPVKNDNRGWSRVIDTAPVQRVPVKPPQRSPPSKEASVPTQKADPRKDNRGPARPIRKPDPRKQPLKAQPSSAPPGGSWINRVGTKTQSTTKLSSKNLWRSLRKDASGEWDLTLYLPEIPVPNGWKALTHPLLKDHGELHKKLMSECGCKISIEGLKNEETEPGVINLHSDVGEEQNIRTAASRLLEMFNEILTGYNLPKTSIPLLSNPRNHKPSNAQKNLPSMKPVHVSKPPPHIKPNYIKTFQKPLPTKPREHPGNAYLVKPSPGTDTHLYGRKCRYCFGLQDCGDEETCWFRPYQS